MASSTGHPVSHERWRLSAQWAGILAGPVTFLVLLETQYVLAYVACETRSTWFLHLATLVAALIVAGAGYAGWRASIDDPMSPKRPSIADVQETRFQRSRWMSATGLGLSALFLLLILAMEIPILVLQECQ